MVQMAFQWHRVTNRDCTAKFKTFFYERTESANVRANEPSEVRGSGMGVYVQDKSVQDDQGRLRDWKHQIHAKHLREA